ncbi:MAG: glycosyltransferase family 2 protein [Thermoanaerobaculia bacterium]
MIRELDRLVARVRKVAPLEVANEVPDSPLVSVIVPTYNHRNFIAQALESVLAQRTDFGFEILVGEDASTDGTREICRDIASRNAGRIRLILQRPENRIVIDGVQTGRFNLLDLLSRCRGEFVAWLDGDDYWMDETKLSAQVETLHTRPDAVMCMTNAVREIDGRRTTEYFVPRRLFRDVSRRELAAGEPIINQSVLFRNVLSDPSFPESILDVVNADTVFWAWLGRFGMAIARPDMQPVVYRVHRGGVWSLRSGIQRARFRRRTFEVVAEMSSDPWVRGRLADRRTGQALKGIAAALRAGEARASLEFCRAFLSEVAARPAALLYVFRQVAERVLFGRRGA